jgi:hypothetical protein
MNHLLHLFVELWIHKGGCAISVQHYLRMAPFHSSYMGKWHKKLHKSDKLFSDKIMAMWAIWTFRSRSKVAPPYILDSKTNSKYHFKHVQIHFSDRITYKVMSIWNCLCLVDNFPKMAAINNGFNDCFRVLIFCVNSR